MMPRLTRRVAKARHELDTRHLKATVLAVWLLGSLAAGCSRRIDASAGEDAAPAVDLELLAYLSQARALHHEANLREAAGQDAEAAATLERLIAARRPHESARVPEIEEVLADTHARVAELRLRAGDVEAASRAVRDGMAHAPEPTYFRGHLLEVEGIVEETRAARLADAGRADEAKKARAVALERLDQAVKVQEKVIERSLQGADGGSR
jgi:hypothetical protein